jgi:DNA repair protein RadC
LIFTGISPIFILNMAEEGRKIPAWPADERPRERLLLQGSDALSDAELLAILLRTGSATDTALDLARELLSRYGSIRGIDLQPAEVLKTVKGIGPAKACQIKAALELSKRLVQEKWKKNERIQCSDDAFHYLRLRMRDLSSEVFRVLFLTSRHDIIEDQVVFKGSLSESVASSREIILTAVRCSAAAIIMVHNHPSGEPAPSPEDKQITHKIVEACRYVDIKVLDHMIIGRDSYFSFADEGMLS